MLDGSGLLKSRPGRFIPGNDPVPIAGGWVGPRAALDGCEKSRHPPPTGIQSTDRPSLSESECLSLFSQILPGKCGGDSFNWATTPFLHVVSNLLDTDVHLVGAVYYEVGCGYTGSVFARNPVLANTTEFAR
jgi:hypothetical protein